MDIKRTYEYINQSKLPKKKFILKRIICDHLLVDNILISETGFSRLNGEDHIVYCQKCGYIKGIYSKEF